MKEPDSVEELVALGVVYSEQGKRLKAKDCFRRALDILPEDPLISYNLALELMGEENWFESLTLLNQAVSGEPDNPDYWCERGIVLFRLERYDEAEESYDLALTFGEEDSRLWNSLGVLRFVSEEYQDAEIFFRRAIELDRKNGDAWFNLADTLDELGNEKGGEEARRVFENLVLKEDDEG
ncbi:tetratricopeptide repeat protein [Oceanispirochaeta sp.]|jgi:tetratricopeptide (TPR) repeat protein|uniref:tetratricopeptide repeat protein n=1 Tax=Oceanispirochaeta sp. TaxID=2035350 RepID=UPI0026231FF3|nr:tetratricopeptide repeat protein [Oceanispirochaeta sp.]MDA3955166.1 tetratricopeptide repeat protein [Oceanispirochaeta sp.]